MLFGRRLRRVLDAVTPRERRALRALESQAESLRTIAGALRIITLAEYHRDPAAEIDERDQRVEVFEPMYADNTGEAIREHVELLASVERDSAAGDRATRVRMSEQPSVAADEPMSERERAWLAEIESEQHAEGSSDGNERPS